MLEIKIHTDNAAFEDNCEHELARILRVLAQKVENGEDLTMFRTVRDINGNDVGRIRLRKGTK